MSLDELPAIASLRYTARWSPAVFERLRAQGDPPSDRAVAELAAAGKLEHFHDLLGAVHERAAAGGAACRDFLAEVSTVPPWADLAAMVPGQRLIAGFPAHMAISLFAGSLCGGAIFQKMTLVTSMTGMLAGASNRRLRETTAMVLGMAVPGALAPGAAGHTLLVRVRLLHSALRRFLVDSGRFRHPAEVPINQHDLAITLALFDYLNLRSLARMGVRPRPAEVAAYHLLWRYAGHVLGIEPALLPATVEEQRDFFYASIKHQGRPDKIPPATTTVLDAVARDATRRVPALFPIARTFLHQSCRWLSGDEYVTGMQLADLGDDHWSVRLLRATGVASSFTWRHVPGGGALLHAAGRRTYRAWLARARRHRDRAGEYRVRTTERAYRPAAGA